MLLTEAQTLNDLLEGIRTRTARVGVIGLGYVGLPLVLLFEEAGFNVLGFDVDEKKTAALSRGESYIRHIGPERIAKAFRDKRAADTNHFARLPECDAVNIALVNGLKIVFGRMNIDIWEVIAAAETKPFGFMPFYPGPGLGGHCIPLDPFYLTWKAAEHGTWARFIELAGEINTSMPRYVAGKIVEALNDDGKSIRDAKVLVLGLAHKN